MKSKVFKQVSRKLYGLVYQYNGRENLLSYENVPVLFPIRGVANESALKRSRCDGLRYRAVALDATFAVK